MAAVKQQVLNWLYSVLTSEYEDVNRTYNDVAQALSHYSSLAPRTDVYTYENGANALLLHVAGILPVDYRGTIYRFPVALWIPHTYPREAPIVYVTPAENMAVRPGQHVDLQGKIYHPYLANWGQAWDRSNILEFLGILRDVFAREPPVIARQQAAPTRPIPQSQQAPPRPPLPPGRASSVASPGPPTHTQGPPLPPPKPGQSSRGAGTSLSRSESGPPLPPLPPQAYDRDNRYISPVSPVSSGFPQHAPQRSSSLRYESAPPLPTQHQRQGSLREHSVSPMIPPEEQHGRPAYNQRYAQPHQRPPSQFQRSSGQGQLQPAQYNHQPAPTQYPPQVQQGQWQNQPQQQQQYHPPHQNQPAPQPQQPKTAPPPIDLLSEPLTLPTPAPANLPAPPIPPNPEKDLLLHNISGALFSQRQHTTHQANTSLPGLSAQHKSMLTSLNAMNAEIQQLESLSSLLSSNTSILQISMREADQVIESSAHRKAPNVDELLVAPTVVGNQLYEAVCEERALGDTLFVLGRAVERGRITPQTFAKMTRGLAREWFLKKALVRKIGVGMGLNH